MGCFVWSRLVRIVEILLRPVKNVMMFRDGRVIYWADEESATRLLLALTGLVGLRDEGRIFNIRV